MIEVRNLSKLYRVGQITRPPVRELVSRVWDKVLGRSHPIPTDPASHPEVNPERTGPEANTFWALRDVSFDVKEGEVLGIIGKNGAGKSTLLKILSRITEPTSGYAKLHGRVASLLEVGTGFHEELTGRENIYLNGTILGLKKREVSARLDEIIDFSGVEKFIDTPVKRYSSGMRVRLAFAVAAHLEPEILIIDEVLAVGDAEFQQKCLGEMDRVARDGRTIIFVSHQLGMIRQLCTRGIYLSGGRVELDGPTEDAITKYIAKTDGISADEKNRPQPEGSPVWLPSLSTLVNGKESTAADADSAIELELMWRAADRSSISKDVEIVISLCSWEGTRLFTWGESLTTIAKDRTEGAIRLTLPKKLLAPGNFSWHATAHIPGHQLFDTINNAAPFQVIDKGGRFSRYEGASHIGYFAPEVSVIYS